LREGRARELDLVFLGCGEAARTHSRTLARVDDRVRLRFASRDSARADALRQERGGVEAYGSYAAALEDPEVDVVFVVTPPATHLELVLRALEAGKDVIVEKPAFLGTGEFRRVREALRSGGGRVLVAENYYYKPLRERLARVIGEGGIGEPLLLQVDAVKRQRPEGWRARRDLSGGGALFEGGIHWLNFMAGLGLSVAGISARRAGGRSRSRSGASPAGEERGRVAEERERGETEESVVVTLEYEEGAVGVLAYSWEVPSPLRGLRLSHAYGREGALTFESNGLFVFLRGTRTRIWAPGLRDIGGYRSMFRDFLDALRTGRKPRMTLEMAERDGRLARDAYASMSSGPEPPRTKPAGQGPAAREAAGDERPAEEGRA